MSTLSLKSSSELGSAAQFVLDITGMARSAAVAAVNQTARNAKKEAVTQIRGRYNLPSRKIEERFSLRPADAHLKAEVIAARRGVALVNYDARQVTLAAPRARGDVLRNIGPGRKQGGISVKVLRDAGRETIKSAFFLPRRAGKESGGNGFGVFLRTGNGRKEVKHLYGMTPAQAFEYWIGNYSGDLAEQLRAAWQDEFSSACAGAARRKPQALFHL